MLTCSQLDNASLVGASTTNRVSQPLLGAPTYATAHYPTPYQSVLGPVVIAATSTTITILILIFV